MPTVTLSTYYEEDYDPSKPIKYEKHELIAQGLAKGLTNSEAGKEAGYTGERTSIWEIIEGNPNITQRSQWLTQTAAEKVGVTIEWWVRAVKNLHDMSLELGELSSANSALDKAAKHIGAYQKDNEQSNSAKAQEDYIKKAQAAKAKINADN
jgi:hypothetical protein